MEKSVRADKDDEKTESDNASLQYMKICNCSIDHVRADPLRIAIALHCIESKGFMEGVAPFPTLHTQSFACSSRLSSCMDAMQRCFFPECSAQIADLPRTTCTDLVPCLRPWSTSQPLHNRRDPPTVSLGGSPVNRCIRSNLTGGPPFQLSVQKGTNRVVIGAVADTSRVWTHVSRQLAAAFAHLCVASRLLER